MSTKTNTGLVAYAQRALSEKWGYCLGTFGNTLTATLLSQKCTQGNDVGEYNTRHKAYLNGFMGKRVSDCYGIVKGYVWTEGNGEPKYIGGQDRNQEGAYSAAKEKGLISSIPEIPGLVLWMKGHAGVYIGNGEFIECAGAPTGMFRGKVSNGKVVSGSKFTHWFRDTYIDYSAKEEKKEEEEMVQDLPVIIDGKETIVKGIQKQEIGGARNYFPATFIAQLGIPVSNQGSVPVFETVKK